MESKETLSESILKNWFHIVFNDPSIEDDGKDLICDYNFILNDLYRLEKLEKVIYLIKNKRIFVEDFIIGNFEKYEDYKAYYYIFRKFNKKNLLTEEEWNLLDEVLKND